MLKAVFKMVNFYLVAFGRIDKVTSCNIVPNYMTIRA